MYFGDYICFVIGAPWSFSANTRIIDIVLMSAEKIQWKKTKRDILGYAKDAQWNLTA